MKKIIAIIVLLCGLQQINAQQLIFQADNPNSNSPKLEINTSTKVTTLTVKVRVSSSRTYTWNQIPALVTDEDRVNRYQMIVTNSDAVAKRTFTIFYSLSRDEQAYRAYVKQEIDFHDRRPTKIVENNYSKIN